MKSKHTDAPWEVDTTEQYYKPCIRHNGVVIALLARKHTTPREPGMLDGEEDANRRLICGAAGLLAAARYTLQNLDAAAHEGLITCPANFQVQLNESARLLREALADAEP